MIESYRQAVEEFKRADHLFHVSLKYTRTVDVIRSLIERIISAFEYLVESLLRCMKEDKAIDEIPENPVGKASLAKEKCDNKEICRYIDIYLKLRRIMRAEYTKREEYRRHVTMIINLDGESFNIDIDLLKEYYDYTRTFLNYIKVRIQGYNDKDN